MSHRRDDSDQFEKLLNRPPSEEKDLAILAADSLQAAAEAEKLVPGSSAEEFENIDWENDSSLIAWMADVGAPPVMLGGSVPITNEWNENLLYADHDQLTDNQKATRQDLKDCIRRSNSQDPPSEEEKKELREKVKKRAKADKVASKKKTKFPPITRTAAFGYSSKAKPEQLAYTEAICIAEFAVDGKVVKTKPKETRPAEALRAKGVKPLVHQCENHEKCLTIFSNLNFQGSSGHTKPGKSVVVYAVPGGPAGDAQRWLCNGPCRGLRKDEDGNDFYHVSINSIHVDSCGTCKDLRFHPIGTREGNGVLIV